LKEFAMTQDTGRKNRNTQNMSESIGDLLTKLRVIVLREGSKEGAVKKRLALFRRILETARSSGTSDLWADNTERARDIREWEKDIEKHENDRLNEIRVELENLRLVPKNVPTIMGIDKELKEDFGNPAPDNRQSVVELQHRVEKEYIIPIEERYLEAIRSKYLVDKQDTSRTKQIQLCERAFELLNRQKWANPLEAAIRKEAEDLRTKIERQEIEEQFFSYIRNEFQKTDGSLDDQRKRCIDAQQKLDKLAVRDEYVKKGFYAEIVERLKYITKEQEGNEVAKLREKLEANGRSTQEMKFIYEEVRSELRGMKTDVATVLSLEVEDWLNKSAQRMAKESLEKIEKEISCSPLVPRDENHLKSEVIPFYNSLCSRLDLRHWAFFEDEVTGLLKRVEAIKTSVIKDFLARERK